jgi:hypothetical protein
MAEAQEQEPAPCSGSKEACGKQAFEDGIAAFERGDFAAALGLFETAQEAKPHPVILFNVALAEAELNRLVDASLHLQQVFEDPKTPGSLLDRVRSERAKVESKIATVTIDDEAAILVVDGRKAEGRPPQARVDPGEHRVEVRVKGQRAMDRPVTLGPGERLRLAVAALTPEPPPPAAQPPAEPSPPPQPRERSVSPGAEQSPAGLSPTWVFVGGGLTAVLGGLTVWSGLRTQAAFKSFQDDVDTLTERQAQDRVDEGERLQSLTNGLLLATAAVGAATTATALLLVDWEDSNQTPGAGVALVVTPGTAGLTGRF